MSRGGTKKARAAQAEARRKREREQKRAIEVKAKELAKEQPKIGKGRAAMLHVLGLPSPFVLAYTLLLAGNVNTEGELLSSGYRFEPFITDGNASYFSEPGGWLLLGIGFAMSLALFVMVVLVWRRLYAGWDVVRRDRSAIDNSFTLFAFGTVLWIFRALVGYSSTLHGIALLFIVFSVYLPGFSALMALIIRPVPGTGRIGGVLPNPMKVPFVERVLLTEEEQVLVRKAAEEGKKLRRQAYDDRQAERRMAKEARAKAKGRR